MLFKTNIIITIHRFKKNIEAQRLNQCLKFKQLVKDKVRIWTLVIWLWDLYTYISMPIWRLKHADRPTLEASVVSSDNNSLSPLGTVPQINPALSYPHFSVHALFSVEIFFPYAFTCQNLYLSFKFQLQWYPFKTFTPSSALLFLSSFLLWHILKSITLV